MPLPLLLIGAAVLAGGYGVKKGVDAKDDFDSAKSTNSLAKSTYDKEYKKLDRERQLAQTSFETLGSTKYTIYKEMFPGFVDSFSKIKNIDYNDNIVHDKFSINVCQSDMFDISNISIEMKDIVISGSGGAAAGALAGLAAYGGVGVFASASTGAAISGLSGVAATNATLAWLGGGSLATGGMGMAGGAAVLGGIVAGPVLAVGGFVMAAKAETALYEASKNLDKAKAAAIEMKTASTVTRGIKDRANNINKVLQELSPHFSNGLDFLKSLVATQTDYQKFKSHEKEFLWTILSIATTIKNISETPVIDKSGVVTKASRKALANASKLVKDLSSFG
mgnify:CR=1 FL=1